MNRIGFTIKHTERFARRAGQLQESGQTARCPAEAEATERRFPSRLANRISHSFERKREHSRYRYVALTGATEPISEVSMLKLMTEEDVSKTLNVSIAALRRWRLEQRGPLFIKVGSLVRYRPEDLESWLSILPKGGDSHCQKRRTGSHENSEVRS